MADCTGNCGCNCNSGNNGIDLNEQLAAQIATLGLQIVADNSRLAQNTLLAFQKDLFQGGQAEVGSALAALVGAKRVSVTPSGLN